MAILKGTQINGNLSVKQNLTVDGNLNVQGDLTYVGVKNLRVKDHQIELNTDDSGSAVLTGENANQAGIVIRGAKNTEKNPSSEEASILYNYDNDTLVVNKTIEGTVASANNAASANKVVNPLTVNVTDESGSVKTVTFDGSAAKTVNVNLQGLQNQINSLTGGTSSIATQISNAIKELDVADAAVAGEYVSSVSETDGKIAVTRAALPDYTKVYDAKGAAAQALVDAKGYADGLAKNYDAAGAAAQALADAKTYVNNRVDGKFDATGSADTAKTEAIAQAKNYTNTEIGKLGAAAHKNVLTGEIADSPLSDNLVTAAQVKTYADGLNTTMDTRVKKLEAIDHDKLAADASAAAVAKVVADAPADFDTLKEVADWIKNDTTGAAALQTDVAGLKTKVSTLESASHTHTNKTELDKIADGDKANWDGHVANANIHVTAEQKTAWTAKQDALTNANVLAAITSTQVSNWDDAAAKAHEHVNKLVLDGITEAKVKAWDGAVSAAGVSSVGGKTGALTLKGGSTKLGEVNLSISDTGEISADIVSNSFDAKGAAATALNDAKAYTDEKVSALSSSVATKDADQDKEINKIKSDITNIENGTTLDGKYVNVSGDIMTGDLTMPRSGNKGIIFGDMKIVWNSTDSAIEFIPTTA